MDKRMPDVGQDLASLATDVTAEVDDVLELLRQKRAGARKVLPMREAAVAPTGPGDDESEPGASEPSSSDAPRKARAAPRQRTKAAAAAEEEVVLQNVTTRLRRDTNELLTEAALRQKLKKVSPDSRQDIIEAALELWFRAEGYV